ncbi:MAG TPA: efflux transporter outer membrane subunit [Thermoanaerobaculia bacterium]
MTMRAVIVLSATLIAGACRPVIRQNAAVPVPVPEQWATATTEPSAEFPDWRELFGDPQLASLIDEALEANPDIDAAAARLDRSLAQARIAGADLYPQVNANFDAARRKQNFIGLPIPGAEDRVLSNTSTTFATGLNVSWEADLWGRIRSGQTAARADAAAVSEDLDAARLSLSGQVARLWFSVLESQQQMQLASETRTNRRETADLVRRRYEAGLTSAVEVRLAESNTSAAEARLELRRRQLDSARRQLEILLGRYPTAAIEGGSLPTPGRVIPAGVPATVLARRPDLRAAERRALAASARVAQARASLYPQLRLTASGGTSTNELRNLLDGDFSVWSIMSNLVQPIFQGGRLRAGIDAASAGEREVLAVFASTALQAFAEVESALFADDALARQERALAAAADHAREAQRSAEQRYTAGLAEYLSVLESQRQAFEIESQLLDARRQRLIARVDLYLALGGDAREPDPELTVSEDVE